MKKRNIFIRGLFALLLAGSTVLLLGCGDLISNSIKTGIFNYISGSVAGGGLSTQFGDFVTDFFTGGYTGDSNNGNN